MKRSNRPMLGDERVNEREYVARDPRVRQVYLGEEEIMGARQ